jgi:hypothetical protein
MPVEEHYQSLSSLNFCGAKTVCLNLTKLVMVVLSIWRTAHNLVAVQIVVSLIIEQYHQVVQYMQLPKVISVRLINLHLKITVLLLMAVLSISLAHHFSQTLLTIDFSKTLPLSREVLSV